MEKLDKMFIGLKILIKITQLSKIIRNDHSDLFQYKQSVPFVSSSHLKWQGWILHPLTTNLSLMLLLFFVHNSYILSSSFSQVWIFLQMGFRSYKIGKSYHHIMTSFWSSQSFSSLAIKSSSKLEFKIWRAANMNRFK